MGDITQKKQYNYRINVGLPMPLGTTKVENGINFAVMVGEKVKNCSVILYYKGTKEVISEILFTQEMRFGNVYAMTIGGISAKEFDYNYRMDNKIIRDPYASIINTSGDFGENINIEEEKTSGFYFHKFNWENDVKLNIPFSDSFIYRLHVRGFTKGKYSKVRKKGTFAGIVEKIDYLKELGVTMIELMPAYEFNEIIPAKKISRYDSKLNREEEMKIDYWGYRDADYFMPKVAYSYKKTAQAAIVEFKTMVKELHKNGIEVCMEFHFGREVTPAYIIGCFRHWVINYHIDGIHCELDNNIKGAISADPYLARTKIISSGFDGDFYSNYKHLGEYNSVFMNTARKFLKGDEGQVGDMAFRIRYNKDFAAAINYIATNDSFTLMDMLSYDRKHNEANGEDNKDGTDYNYSWNCGFEGETRRKNVLELRRKQFKNAMCFLMLSQGTPLLYAGDEFGNSCNGNNNPYCQDNDISYLDWRLVNKNAELLKFTKMLVKFRKEHDILHMDKMLQCKDYRSLGFPDMSYHSEQTWELNADIFSRTLGVMLNGVYCSVEGKNPEEMLYIAMNMHWERKRLGIPKPGKYKRFKAVFSTNEEIDLENVIERDSRYIDIEPRSIVVFESDDLSKQEIEEIKKEEKEKIEREKARIEEERKRQEEERKRQEEARKLMAAELAKKEMANSMAFEKAIGKSDNKTSGNKRKKR